MRGEYKEDFRLGRHLGDFEVQLNMMYCCSLCKDVKSRQSPCGYESIGADLADTAGVGGSILVAAVVIACRATVLYTSSCKKSRNIKKS